MTIQELAAQVVAAKETLWRTDGALFVTLRAGSPEWMTNLMRAAHDGGDWLPDDWRYACAFAACEALADLDESADFGAIEHDFAESHVDTYTHDRLAWLASDGRRPGYVDTAVDEYGRRDDGQSDIIADIGGGQYMEALEVFGAVAAFLGEMIA